MCAASAGAGTHPLPWGETPRERRLHGPGAARPEWGVRPRSARSRCSSPRVRRTLAASRRAAAQCKRFTTRAAPRHAGRLSQWAANPLKVAGAGAAGGGITAGWAGWEPADSGAAGDAQRPRRPSRGASTGPSPAPRRAAASASVCCASVRATFRKSTLYPRAHTQPSTRRASATRPRWLWALRDPDRTPAP